MNIIYGQYVTSFTYILGRIFKQSISDLEEVYVVMPNKALAVLIERDLCEVNSHIINYNFLYGVEGLLQKLVQDNIISDSSQKDYYGLMSNKLFWDVYNEVLASNLDSYYSLLDYKNIRHSKHDAAYQLASHIKRMIGHADTSLAIDNRFKDLLSRINSNIVSKFTISKCLSEGIEYNNTDKKINIIYYLNMDSPKQDIEVLEKLSKLSAISQIYIFVTSTVSQRSFFSDEGYIEDELKVRSNINRYIANIEYLEDKYEALGEIEFRPMANKGSLSLFQEYLYYGIVKGGKSTERNIKISEYSSIELEAVSLREKIYYLLKNNKCKAHEITIASPNIDKYREIIAYWINKDSNSPLISVGQKSNKEKIYQFFLKLFKGLRSYNISSNEMIGLLRSEFISLLFDGETINDSILFIDKKIGDRSDVELSIDFWNKFIEDNISNMIRSGFSVELFDPIVTLTEIIKLSRNHTEEKIITLEIAYSFFSKFFKDFSNLITYKRFGLDSDIDIVKTIILDRAKGNPIIEVTLEVLFNEVFSKPFIDASKDGIIKISNLEKHTITPSKYLFIVGLQERDLDSTNKGVLSGVQNSINYEYLSKSEEIFNGIFNTEEAVYISYNTYMNDMCSHIVNVIKNTLIYKEIDPDICIDIFNNEILSNDRIAKDIVPVYEIAKTLFTNKNIDKQDVSACSNMVSINLNNLLGFIKFGKKESITSIKNSNILSIGKKIDIRNKINQLIYNSFPAKLLFNTIENKFLNEKGVTIFFKKECKYIKEDLNNNKIIVPSIDIEIDGRYISLQGSLDVIAKKENDGIYIQPFIYQYKYKNDIQDGSIREYHLIMQILNTFSKNFKIKDRPIYIIDINQFNYKPIISSHKIDLSKSTINLYSLETNINNYLIQ